MRKTSIREYTSQKMCLFKTDKMVDNKGIVRSTKEVKDPFVRKSLYILIADYIDRLNKIDISTWTVNEVV